MHNCSRQNTGGGLSDLIQCQVVVVCAVLAPHAADFRVAQEAALVEEPQQQARGH